MRTYLAALVPAAQQFNQLAKLALSLPGTGETWSPSQMLSQLLYCLRCSLWHHSHKHCLLLCFNFLPSNTCHPESINREQDSFAFQRVLISSVFIFGTTSLRSIEQRMQSLIGKYRGPGFDWYPAVLSEDGQVVQRKAQALGVLEP